MGIYKSFENAKNGTPVPVFNNGRTMDSRYNPQREAETLCNSITDAESFFLVLGIGSGIFLKLLHQKFPEARIVALELFNDDITFLLQSETVKELKENPSLIFSDLDSIENILIQNYLPSKYGNLKIIEQRGWVNENAQYIEKINSKLQKTLGIISADYSVQAHFGKIWTSNILNNVKLAQNLISKRPLLEQNDLQKTAVIVAAGPSLDKTISILKEESSDENKNYFIISTDTAAQSLVKQNIIPDVIISIDGQSVSYNHFLNINDSVNKKTLFAFDLSANTSAARHIISNGNQVLFFCSGHPLASAINASCGKPFPCLFSGAGTVTITAVDFAVNAGFKNIKILGADFSYSNGKAYAAGTYLDALYNKSSSRITDTEQTYSKLMFRTELTKLSPTSYTTQILKAYRISLEKYLTEKGIQFKKQNEVYSLNCPSLHSDTFFLTKDTHPFSLKAFFDNLKSSEFEEYEPLLLPYIAWLRNNMKNTNINYNDLVKLALDTIVSYNI